MYRDDHDRANGENILHRFCGTLSTVAMLAQWNRLRAHNIDAHAHGQLSTE